MRRLNDNHAYTLHSVAGLLLVVALVAAMLFVEIAPTWMLILSLLGAFGLWTATAERL